MSDAPYILNHQHPGVSPQQVRDARARAWAYAFQCFHRREGQEGGPTTAPKDDVKESNGHVAKPIISK
jgi:hypothetical protein